MLAASTSTAATTDREAAILALRPIVRKMAAKIAFRTRSTVLDKDDLESVGWAAAIRAVDKFDPTRGVPIAAYAAQLITGAMMNEVRRMDPVSESTRRIIRRGRNAADTMRAETHTEPTTAAVEAVVPGYAAALKRNARAPMSLDLEHEMPAGGTATLHDFLPGTSDVETVVVTHEETARLDAIIGKLGERRQRVIRDHYFEDRPLNAIATDLSVSSQRASQIHLAALQALRRNYAGV